MKKALMVMGVLAFATSAMALTFTEDFSDAVGSEPNPAEWSITPGYGDFNAVSTGSDYGNPAPGLIVNNNYGTTTHGITHEFGQTLTASATDDVSYSYDYRSGTTTSRKRGDWIIEISNGDYHAPAFGTVLETPIPVLAVAKPYSDSIYLHVFDGKQWLGTVGAIPDANWHTAGIDVHADGTYSVWNTSDGSSYSGLTSYAGTSFDRVSILYPGAAPAGAYWFAVDNISVTGVPEPMTLVLLGLGGLFLRRRR